MDLPRLCQASGVGARTFKDKIPLPEIPSQFLRLHIDPLQLALHGGEDYELLFTVPPRLAPRLGRAPAAPSLKMIGEITRGREILLVASDGTASKLPSFGWDHFRANKRKRGR